MLSRISRTAVCRTSAKTKAHAKVLGGGARRGLVQPSGADRASVVDLPSTYQDESHFTPRSGMRDLSRRLIVSDGYRYARFQTGNACSRRVGQRKNSTYILGHASPWSIPSVLFRYLDDSHAEPRPRRPLIPAYSTPCFRTSPTNMGTPTVGHTRTDGKQSRPSKTRARYVARLQNYAVDGHLKSVILARSGPHWRRRERYRVHLWGNRN